MQISHDHLKFDYIPDNLFSLSIFPKDRVCASGDIQGFSPSPVRDFFVVSDSKTSGVCLPGTLRPCIKPAFQQTI